MARPKRSAVQQDNDAPEAGHNSKELSPAEVKALKMHHFRAISAQKERVAEQQAEYKRLRKLAKADTIVLSDIDFMMRCAEIEDADIISDRLKREIEIASWFALPVQFQADLFGADKREPGEDRAAREGAAAGYAGKACEPPYEANSPMGRAWEGAWKAAQAKMLADLESAMTKRNALKADESELIKGGGDPDFDDADPAKQAAE